MRTWFIFALGAVALDACVMQGYSARERVTLAAREYNDGVRWGKWDQAASHIALAERTHFLDRRKSLEDELEIADYEMVGLDIDKSGKHDCASARVDYSWMLKSQGIVQKTSTMQKWEDKDGGWILVREERLSGVPLTLFEEPRKVEK